MELTSRPECGSDAELIMKIVAQAVDPGAQYMKTRRMEARWQLALRSFPADSRNPHTAGNPEP